MTRDAACPRCQKPITIQADQRWKRVTCPACGCRFIGENSSGKSPAGNLAADQPSERPAAPIERPAGTSDTRSPASSKENIAPPSKRRPLSEWLRVVMAGIAVVAVSVIVVLLATHALNLRSRTNPDLPREYVTVAKFLARSTSTEPKTFEHANDLAQGMAEAQEAILNLDGAAYADPQLATLSGQAVASLRNLLELASEIQGLPEPPSALTEVILGVVQGYTGDVDDFLSHYNDLVERDQLGQALGRRIIVELTKLKSQELLLPAIARKYAGPPLADPQVVAIDFDEALFAEQLDRLALRNGSKYVLHHCTIAVTLTAPDGETKRHVHFIQEWPPGQAVYAHYSGGKTPYDRPIRDSLASIDSVSVSLFCDELSCEDVVYRYSGEEKDRDVAGFLQPFRLALEYRPFAAGIIFNDEPAAICSFSGLPALPRGKLAVTFHHGEQSRTEILAFESWKAGAKQTLKFPKLQWRPDGWSAALQLNGAAFHPVSDAYAAPAASTAKSELSLPFILGMGAALFGAVWLVKAMLSASDGGFRFNGKAPKRKLAAGESEPDDATEHRAGRPATIGDKLPGERFLRQFVSNRNAATLAVTAFVLLIAGLVGPFMNVAKLGDQDRFSLLAGVARLVDDGHFALGAVIFLFSVVFPLAKLSLILAATSSLAPLSHAARHRLHHLAELTAKYSLLDVVVIALLIVVLKVDGLAEVKPGWGTFSFLAAALTSMLAGLSVDAKQWEL